MIYSDDINLLKNAEHYDPFKFLGFHYVDEEKKAGVVIRFFYPFFEKVYLYDLSKNKKYLMEKIDNDGIFQIVFPRRRKYFKYNYLGIDENGNEVIVEDPYRFLPVISDFDLYLFNEGNHHHIYRYLGSHCMKVDGIEGTLFAVWAPEAKRVSVVGDFNRWDGRIHQMRVRGSTGVWEIFIPGVLNGSIYKYEIKDKYNNIFLKSDPYAFFSEVRPKTASIVYSLDNYKWQDEKFLQKRRKSDLLKQPINVYEVHIGSWMRVPEQGNRVLTYRELADKLIPYVKEMGYTHIELMPVEEHPLDDSWGYQVTGYYAPTSRYGTPDDLRYFIDKCHQNDIGVILDWVPGHFPRDAHGLAKFDGSNLYEHMDPREGEHPHWGTLIFNYGRNEVRNFLMANAIYWINEFHFDGLRVDAVASMLYRDYGKKDGEWVPNIYGGRENLEAIAFLQKVNEVVYSYFPGILMIAEESTAWPGVSKPVYVGGLGFGYKWNMGWMHDSLEYFSKDPVYRKYHHSSITFSLMYAFSENFILPISHDEVVHGKKSLLDKMPGDLWQKFANLRLFLTYMYTHPGKKLLFMGSEIGQWREWDFKSSLDWHLLEYTPHKKLHKFVKDLNGIYKKENSLWELDNIPDGFEWIDFHDTENSIISYYRRGLNHDDIVVVVLNLTPVVRHNYRIGVPLYSYYEEILNSDSEIYWGSNIGNGGGVHAEHIAWQDQPFSININLPPLGALIFKPVII